jgi:hypothetical protein
MGSGVQWARENKTPPTAKNGQGPSASLAHRRPRYSLSRYVPSLKEPVLSRVVSADFVAWECLHVRCICRRSPSSIDTDFLPLNRAGFFASLFFVRNVLRLSTVLRLLLRGLFGRSFQHAAVPLPVPSWTPADRKLCPRSGAIRPTPIKSIRSPCGTPSRSIISRTPGGNRQVKGTHRADREPQGFARPQAANQHRHIVERFLRFLVLDARLQEPDAEDRATVGTDPSAALGLGEE